MSDEREVATAASRVRLKRLHAPPMEDRYTAIAPRQDASIAQSN